MIALLQGFGQLIMLLAELAPSMVKLWRAWQERNGRLTADERRRLSQSVRASVKSRNTTDLEHFLTGGRLPEAKAEVPTEDKAS